MAARLTDRPGSSAYVLGGVVVYSNEAKVAHAGVPARADRARSGRCRRRWRPRWPRAPAARFGADARDRHHRHRRPGRRHAGEAGGDRLPVRGGRRRAALIERTVRLPGDRAVGPRAHHDRRACTCCGACCSATRRSRRRERPDRGSLRLFVALELPEAARAALVAFRDAAADPASGGRSRRGAPPHARVPRPPPGRATCRRSTRSCYAARPGRRRGSRSAARCCSRRAARGCCAPSLADPDGTLGGAPGARQRRAGRGGRLRAGEAPVPRARDRRAAAPARAGAALGRRSRPSRSSSPARR